ncbi:hypothetical protein [Brevibacillus reuszeri]|uniref:hypothetical protein n=1 Tax=Brevibacillus reuszeri TaxID=54915 RepID=UPI0013DEC2AD|nr:hypothetical protein [Brevibacillus reuszeri]
MELTFLLCRGRHHGGAAGSELYTPVRSYGIQPVGGGLQAEGFDLEGKVVKHARACDYLQGSGS